MFKLALVQMAVVGGAKKENLNRALRSIDEAAKNGAQVVLLPEAMNLGWTHPSSKNEADEIPNSPFCDALQNAADRHGIFVCAGLVERSGDKVYNSALLIGPNNQSHGGILLHHRKINELEIAHDYYVLGDRLGVADTPLGRFGLMICADAFAEREVISRTLCLMGADVILSPCAWAVVADHDNGKTPYGSRWLDCYGCVAKDFRVWIASASNVGWITDGPWRGRKCIGCSLVIGPDGEPAARGPYGVDAERIIYVDVEPVKRPAQGDGWDKLIG